MKPETKVTGNGLQITRVFDAPRRQVFSWWTSPEKLQQWSGCKDATNCQIQMDFRIGGGFQQKMQIRGAGEFAFSGVYEEIVEPEKIAYRVEFGPVVTRVVVQFFEQGSRTKVVLTHNGFPDEAFCKNVTQGTGESLDKLETLVSGGSRGRLAAAESAS
jgi:uncharacterized protein YndB with AHSA1/START domain